LKEPKKFLSKYNRIFSVEKLFKLYKEGNLFYTEEKLMHNEILMQELHFPFMIYIRIYNRKKDIYLQRNSSNQYISNDAILYYFFFFIEKNDISYFLDKDLLLKHEINKEYILNCSFYVNFLL
jgi:hypothetical protein